MNRCGKRDSCASPSLPLGHFLGRSGALQIIPIVEGPVACLIAQQSVLEQADLDAFLQLLAL